MNKTEQIIDLLNEKDAEIKQLKSDLDVSQKAFTAFEEMVNPKIDDSITQIFSLKSQLNRVVDFLNQIDEGEHHYKNAKKLLKSIQQI